MATVFIGLGVLFFLGHALSWFFQKTKIPDLLILVILGYSLGPVFGILNPEDFGKVGAVISTTALIVILYEGGLNLSARDLLTSSLPALGMSLVGFFLIVGVSAGLVYLLGFQSWPVAALVGLGIGSTSSAIVIPMVKPLNIGDKTKTILSLESAFTDVLAIILFLSVVEALASGVFNTTDILVGIGSKPLLSTAAGVGFGLIWALIKKKFSGLVSMAFAGEAYALFSYGLLEIISMNGAIGVLALGFTLANLDLLPQLVKNQISRVPVSYNDLSLLSEITFLLRTFFFIYLGLLVQFSNWQIVSLAFLLSLMILITRYFSVRLLFPKGNYTKLEAFVATAMGPRGLACAVLATIPLQKGLPGGEFIQSLVFAIIPISILFTALFVSLAENQKVQQSFGRLFAPYKPFAPPRSQAAEGVESLPSSPKNS